MSTETERTGNGRLSVVESMNLTEARRQLESLGEKEVWDEFDFKTIDTLLQQFPALAGEEVEFLDDDNALVESAPIFMVARHLPRRGKEHLDLLCRIYEVTPTHNISDWYGDDPVFVACWGGAEAMIWLLIEKFPETIKSHAMDDVPGDGPLRRYIENYDEPCADLVQVFVNADPTASLSVSGFGGALSALLRGLMKRLDPSILKLLLPRDPTNNTLDLSGGRPVTGDERGGPVEAALLAGNLPSWISTVKLDTRFWSSEGLCVLFVLLANNVSLQQFEIRFYEPCDAEMLRNLSFFLHESRHLRILKLIFNMPSTEDNIAGDDIDSIIDAAATGLCDNTCVVELRLEFLCSPSNMRGVRSLLSGCQRLADLEIRMHESTRLLNESAASLVYAVEHCPTLTRFHLQGPVSGTEQFIDMVASHKSIKIFWIDQHDCNSDLLGVTKLVNVESLRIVVRPSSGSDERLALAILELVAGSKVLRDLVVHAVSLPPVGLCEILKNNTILQRMSILGDKVNSSAALVEVLEQNCTLRDVVVETEDGQWPNRPEFSYYCRLNASGRGRLRLPGTTKAEVLELLGHIAPPATCPHPSVEAIFRVPDHEEDSVRYGILREAPHLWCQIEERLPSPESGRLSEVMAKSDQQVPKRRRLDT